MTTATENTRHILPLLDTQLRLTAELESLLQAEYQALLGSDLATLAALVARKRSTAESLERCSFDLGQHTGGMPQTVVPQLGPEALQRWQQLGVAADGLRRQNMHNGALLNERQNRLRWVAERANRETPALYAPRINSSAMAGLSGRSLARA